MPEKGKRQFCPFSFRSNPNPLSLSCSLCLILLDEEGSVITFGGYRDGILDERNMEWYSIKAPDPNAEADLEEKQKFESFSVLNFNN